MPWFDAKKIFLNIFKKIEILFPLRELIWKYIFGHFQLFNLMYRTHFCTWKIEHQHYMSESCTFHFTSQASFSQRLIVFVSERDNLILIFFASSKRYYLPMRRWTTIKWIIKFHAEMFKSTKEKQFLRAYPSWAPSPQAWEPWLYT